jgi:hypothetical protein
MRISVRRLRTSLRSSEAVWGRSTIAVTSWVIMFFARLAYLVRVRVGTRVRVRSEPGEGEVRIRVLRLGLGMMAR